MSAPPPRLVALLRCVECAGRDPLEQDSLDGRPVLRCPHGHTYPFADGTARILRVSLRDSMARGGSGDAAEEAKRRTAASFGYEWRHFADLRPEWERNFLAYMAPHGHEFFPGKLVLDAGSGAGRHAYYAARDGADVVAVDLGPAIDVTRRNTADLANILAVQADLYDLPFADGTFDFAYSIGVLHHLPDPEAAFRQLLRVVRPGGEVGIYVYWRHEHGVRGALLRLVTAARRVTTRLPHPVLHLLSYPIAAVATALFVWPARLLARIPPLREVALRLPLAGYMHYPFIVCVNDQFDRFSAPLERRYTEAEVRAWLGREGLEDVHVLANYGWVAGGRKPGGGGAETRP